MDDGISVTGINPDDGGIEKAVVQEGLPRKKVNYGRRIVGVGRLALAGLCCRFGPTGKAASGRSA